MDLLSRDFTSAVRIHLAGLSLRHTSVTYALLGGATVEETQKMARHADISTTMVYAHHVDRIRSNAEAKTSSYLDEAL